MERMKDCYSVDDCTADLVLLGVCRCSRLSYPQANNGQGDSKCDCEYGREVKAYSEKEITACSIACVVRLWYCEHPECASPHRTPMSRSPWKAVSREAETWKLKTEITGFSVDGTKLGPLAFRCMAGRQHGHATERLAYIALGWITLAGSRCVGCNVTAPGYWMVNNSTISSAHNALLGCFILRVHTKRMKSQCLLYLILEQKSNAFWVVQTIGSGLVIMLVITVSRKPASMSMT